VVAAGGVSAEREVSLRSGGAVAEALAERGHKVSLVDLRKESATPLIRRKPDCVVIALHGGFGEDGRLQAQLDAAGIAYTGSGAASSALAIDKQASREAFIAHGVAVADGVEVTAFDATAQLAGMAGRHGWPLVIKPSTEGSSIGVTIADDPAAGAAGLTEAFRHGSRVLIERYIRGRELCVAVLDGHILPLVGVRPQRRFFDYEAKYESGDTLYDINPDLPAAHAARVERAGLQAFNALGCSGLARVDVMLEESTGEAIVLEVNTCPGMTATSLAPKAARAAGYGFGHFLELQVRVAMRDRELLRRLASEFRAAA
ncbi:MAG: D-alanine--D-alanine ligase, partial [Planctomycetota bacterium]